MPGQAVLVENRPKLSPGFGGKKAVSLDFLPEVVYKNKMSTPASANLIAAFSFSSVSSFEVARPTSPAAVLPLTLILLGIT